MFKVMSYEYDKNEIIDLGNFETYELAEKFIENNKKLNSTLYFSILNCNYSAVID